MMPLRLESTQTEGQIGGGLPRPAQKPGASSAGNQQQGEGMLASHPEQKLVPFVKSAMALHERAPSSGAAQALAEGSAAAQEEADGQTEHAGGVPEEQQVSACAAGSMR